MLFYGRNFVATIPENQRSIPRLALVGGVGAVGSAMAWFFHTSQPIRDKWSHNEKRSLTGRVKARWDTMTTTTMATGDYAAANDDDDGNSAADDKVDDDDDDDNNYGDGRRRRG